MKTLQYCLLLAVGCVLMASCGYPDHLKTLPKETVAVVSFDLAGMVSKGDLHKLQEADFYKKMQEKMAEEDAESAKETDEFLKNPLNYGINFLEPVYLFVINNPTSPFVGASIALGDAAKFETFIVKAINTDSTSTSYAIEKATGYSFIATSEILIAWSETVLIVSAADSQGVNTASLQGIFTEKDKEQSVVGQAGFKSYYKNSKDISGWLSIDAMRSFANTMNKLDADADYSEDMEKMREQMKGSSFQMHISFLEDEIHTEYSAELSKELQKQYDAEILRKGSPEKVSNFVRGSDLAVFSASINLQNYLSLMSNNPALSGESKETMAGYVAVVQQFIAPFDGDILFTVSDITVTEREVTEQIPVADTDTTEELTADASGELDEWDWDLEYKDTTYMKKETLPVFLAATTVNDESLGLMLGMVLGKDKPKAGKVTSTDMGGVVLYSTIKDKVVLYSNDKKTIEDINAGTFNADGSSLQAKGANEHGVYVYANLDLEDYPQLVKEELGSTSDNAVEKAAMMQFLGIFEHFEAYHKNDYSAVVSFKLKQNGNNSLYTVIEGIGNAAYTMGALN